MEGAKVFPSEAVSEQTIKLSICDTYSPKLWVTQALFWPSKDAHSFQLAFHVLKEGLSRTLSEIPSLAGTIGRSSDDPRDLLVKVDADSFVDFGVEDLSGVKEIPSYATLKEQGFPMVDLRMPLSQKITLSPVVEGSAMLTAKLNRLDGGIALTFGFNHLLADYSTVAEVERVWSLHTADVSADRKQSHKPAVGDLLVRKQLSTAVPGAGEFTDEHWKVFPTEFSQLNLPKEVPSAEAALTMLQKAKEAHVANLKGSVGEPRWCIWKISPGDLAKLKKDAAGSDAAKWISTMDALIGLFWSRMAFIKQASQSGHETSSACFPINIRQRLQPPVNPQYIGNVVDIISAECSLKELEANDTGLAAAAQSVRQAVGGWTQSKWESWLSMAATLPADQAICPNPLMLLASHNIGFNDYSKAQSNVLDWGSYLGRVERTRYLKPASTMTGCATAIVVHPRLPDGGLEIATTSNDETRMALENDAKFGEYAKLHCFFA